MTEIMDRVGLAEASRDDNGPHRVWLALCEDCRKAGAAVGNSLWVHTVCENRCAACDDQLAGSPAGFLWASVTIDDRMPCDEQPSTCNLLELTITGGAHRGSGPRVTTEAEQNELDKTAQAVYDSTIEAMLAHADGIMATYWEAMDRRGLEMDMGFDELMDVVAPGWRDVPEGGE